MIRWRILLLAQQEIHMLQIHLQPLHSRRTRRYQILFSGYRAFHVLRLNYLQSQL